MGKKPVYNMNMTLKLISIENNNTWEDFLLIHSPQALFQSWLWGEVQKKTGQKVLRLGISDGTSLLGIAQIFVVRARRGTYLHIRHGPIWKQLSKAYWQQLLMLLRPLAQKEHAWFIRISPLIDNSLENRSLFSSLGMKSAPIHEVDAERCWVLDIDKPDEVLLMGMRKTTRYEVRRGEKFGVSVEMTKESNRLDEFYSLYEETSQRHGFVVHTSITEEFEAFVKEDKALLFFGNHDNKILAGAIILFYGGQAIYHHGASISSKIPASYVVQWKSIIEAKKRGIKLYNFYGIAPDDKPNHPWRGITLFKKGFGGRQINYIHAHDLPVSPMYLVPKTIEAIRTRMRGY
jgi:lipid II:glycine glycyltransferase (peptidoglycan interpeptide bridge formation enzyme)